jgi:hypothetical protein
MENFAWFQDYGARKNLSVNIPVCVLTLNWQNIPDIIRFANEKDVSINFVYVDRPISLALVNKPAKYLEPIIQFYNTQQFELISSKSKVNISRFHGLISDLVKWKESNSFAIESAMSLQNKEIDYLSAVEQLIFKSEDVGIKHNEEAQNELLTKITMVLNEVEREKWPLIYERLSSTPMSVIYSYIKGKSRSELLTMFSEYTG